jgi:Mitochondrial K+-H+ exchange-related
MKFFFVRDYSRKYRYFSSETLSQIKIKSSRWKEIWELAKKKLMLLPQRVLRQEQAFGRVLKLEEKKIQVFHSGRLDEKRLKIKFYFFLQKQRTKHIFMLTGEVLLLPISGLAIILPGPNVFFGYLALLTITHWQAFKGINRLLKKEHEFISSSLFKDWEQTLESKKEESYSQILGKIEKKYNLHDIHKVLWK